MGDGQLHEWGLADPPADYEANNAYEAGVSDGAKTTLRHLRKMVVDALRDLEEGPEPDGEPHGTAIKGDCGDSGLTVSCSDQLLDETERYFTEQAEKYESRIRGLEQYVDRYNNMVTINNDLRANIDEHVQAKIGLRHQVLEATIKNGEWLLAEAGWLDQQSRQQADLWWHKHEALDDEWRTKYDNQNDIARWLLAEMDWVLRRDGRWHVKGCIEDGDVLRWLLAESEWNAGQEFLRGLAAPRHMKEFEPESSWNDGYDAGYVEGHGAGHRAGRQEIKCVVRPVDDLSRWLLAEQQYFREVDADGTNQMAHAYEKALQSTNDELARYKRRCQLLQAELVEGDTHIDTLEWLLAEAHHKYQVSERSREALLKQSYEQSDVYTEKHADLQLALWLLAEQQEFRRIEVNAHGETIRKAQWLAAEERHYHRNQVAALLQAFYGEKSG